MIDAPWNIVLTLLFVFTGAVCARELIVRRGRPRTQSGVSDDAVIDITHLVMSAAMILMLWVMVIDAVTWAQVALFAVFALALVPAFRTSRDGAARISLAGHVVLDAAMIWMLAAMPLLMSDMPMSGGGHAAHHGGMAMAEPTPTPVWADVVNGVFIVLCLAVALWWAVQLVRVRGHRLHASCHLLMGAGMAAMLWLMNA
ncbi:DUF5134 domain-containing protein [uncultured Microbacterium sp.]|uniref:DUF5134 domain-containing protein n=1 Tax=uncultured Microbacterium sp. TaxID=191216 RepID=UPI0025E3D3B1|nr:DUF5134 domain-containing protein [uncultured Microbacterium sp.]